MSLELQRFWGVSKNDRVKLRARFAWRRHRYRPRGAAPKLAGSPGGLHTDGDGGLAALRADCRRVAVLMVRFPQLAAVRPRPEAQTADL